MKKKLFLIIPILLCSCIQSNNIDKACNWLIENQLQSNNYLIAINIADKQVNAKDIETALEKIKPKSDNPSELARYVLSQNFCKINSQDYIDKLSMIEKIDDTGIFGAINTLNAFKSATCIIPSDAVNTKESLVKLILEYQNDDGGFSLQKGLKSEIDTTAFAITALSNSNAKDNINLAFDYLKNNQDDDQYFTYYGTKASESLSCVIIAINSLPATYSTQLNETDLINLLLKYQNSDGGFSHIIGGESNAMATEQAIIALKASEKSINPYVI